MLAVCLLPPVTFAEESWQVWFDQAAKKALGETAAIRAGQSFHYDCDNGRFATYYLEAGYARYLLPWLDLGLAYRQQYDKRDSRWIEENRPYADATLRWTIRQMALSARNRVEYRIRHEQDDTWRYRNKLALQYDAWGAGFGLKPYVAAEAFVDESAKLKERDQSRFTVGVRTDPERRLPCAARSRLLHLFEMDYYVTRQRVKKSGEWTDAYIAGVQLGARF